MRLNAWILKWLLALLLSLCCAPSTRAFVILPTHTVAATTIQSLMTTTATTTADDFTLPDRNDNPIRVGSVVQVIAPNLKAYHVPSKAFGRFDTGGTFIPDGDAKNLHIPVGLKGTVMKVFDNSSVSVNYQIQVQFVPGANDDDPYDPPVPFSMHFSPQEVELVE